MSGLPTKDPQLAKNYGEFFFRYSRIKFFIVRNWNTSKAALQLEAAVKHYLFIYLFTIHFTIRFSSLKRCYT